MHIYKEGVGVKLINLHGKVGMFNHAQKTFDEMPVRGLWSFNTLMGACANSKKFDEVNRLFQRNYLLNWLSSPTTRPSRHSVSVRWFFFRFSQFDTL
ncbi:hypothetical protein SLEP1_g29496 [Rubroshorea leprosula]|uniref:Pentatricopeptide repeat-containing protein n=1 Tax=Rubroshorea leprosula TaxID=152421 RepID=A0AAV5K654_9ROSI|nr:hypothetical protein SLEP1_g29496 [Rubroshorea leprosula]